MEPENERWNAVVQLLVPKASKTCSYLNSCRNCPPLKCGFHTQTGLLGLVNWVALFLCYMEWGTLKLWNTATGVCLHTFEGHTGYVYGGWLLSNEQYFISVSIDGTLKMWDIHTRQCVRTFRQHSAGVLSCCVLSTDAHILSWDFRNVIKVWDTKSGRCLRTFNAGHSFQGSRSCCVSSNDHFIVSGGNDGFIKIWDMSTGELYKSD